MEKREQQYGFFEKQDGILQKQYDFFRKQYEHYLPSVGIFKLQDDSFPIAR